MDMILIESIVDEGYEASSANELYDRAQASNTLLVNSDHPPSLALRGQLWVGAVSPATLQNISPSSPDADHILTELEVFFPSDASLLLRQALTQPHQPLRMPSTSSSARPVTPMVLCGNCEEAPPTLECRDCQQDLPPPDTLFCEKCFDVHLATKQFKHHFAQPYVPPKQKPHPIVGHMHTLINQMEELSTSEAKLLSHLHTLSDTLRQLSYISIPSMRLFSESAECVAFRVAVDGLVVVSELFLHTLNEIRLNKFRKKLDSIEYSTIDNLLAQCSNMQSVFAITIQKYQPIFQSYANIVRLFEPLSSLLSRQINTCPEFGEAILFLEASLSESLLSLLTKPLARIPAYILACREMYVTVMTIVSVVDEEYSEVLQYTERVAKKIYNDMINVLAHCYEEAKEEQQKRQLHELHAKFTRGKSPIDVSGLVTTGRRIVRQGTLRRHFKLGRQGKVRRVTLHVLSDILLGSSAVYKAKQQPPPKLKKSVSFENGILKKSVIESYDSVQKEFENANQESVHLTTEYDLVEDALHLDFCIPLSRRSGTVCLPVPSFLSTQESNWFVVIGAQKTVYICADSVTERDAWVSDLQDVLTVNTAESCDIFRIKNQRSLVNTLLSEINTRAGERLTASPLAVDGVTPADKEEICRQNVSNIQLNWWGLYDVLEGIVRAAAKDEEGVTGGDGSTGDGVSDSSNPLSPITHLRHVIDLHTQEFTETLLSLCPSSTGRESISAALASGTSNPAAEHLVAVDWFYQRSDAMNEKQQASESTSSTSSLRRWGGNSDTRPTVLLLFVMSNVILAVRVVSNVSIERASHFSVEYSFHVELRHLECAHYVWDSELNGQKVAANDTSAPPNPPSSCNKSTQSTSRGDPTLSSAILIRDTSITAMFKSLLGQNSISERVIFAPSVESKQRWLEFLGDYISMFKNCDTGVADGVESARCKLLSNALPTLRRVTTRTVVGPGSGIWTTE